MQFICIARNIHFLHGRKFLDHVNDEVVGYLLQVLQNLDGAVEEVGLVVLDAPLLAEGLDEFVALGEVVAGHHREEVMVDLVLEAAAEPVDEELGEAVSPVMWRVVVTWSFQKSGRVVAS